MDNLNVLNYLYPSGHRFVDSCILDVLSKDHYVNVLSPAGYFFEEGFQKNISVATDDRLVSADGGVLGRMCVFRNMKRLHSFFRSCTSNRTLVLAFDPFLYAFAGSEYHTDETYLMHHRSVDEIATNRVKRLAFDYYKNKVKHLVFEDFIKDYLVSVLNVTPERVTVIPHPINRTFANAGEGNWFAVGVSGSNDETFIRKLISVEKQERLLLKNQCRVYLKSKEAEFDNGALVVSPSYLQDDEMRRLSESSKIMLHPFKTSYKYRTSATLLESLGNGRPSISTRYAMALDYASRYPGSVVTCGNANNYYRRILELWQRYRAEGFDTSWQEDIVFCHSRAAMRQAFAFAFGENNE